MAVPGTEAIYYASQSVSDEDCLNLNIWTPDIAGKAPVLFWIHGGAFLCGSGSGSWTDGARMARDHGIVVVSVNYRLGYLGGLFLGDYDERYSNQAIQDQTLALKWVQQNIAAFGGDPDHVTVGGHSAGAVSVASLLIAPGARGLFRRVFLESGHLEMMTEIGKARETTDFLLRQLSVDPAGDVLAQLRDISIFRILAVQRMFGIGRRVFPTVLDGVTLASDPYAALSERSDIDILIGSTSEEDRLFPITGWAPPERSLPATIAAYLRDPDAQSEAAALYAPVLKAVGGDAANVGHVIATEHGWGEPVRYLAHRHAAAGGRGFVYEFGWKSPGLGGRTGAAHVVDLPFFFDNLDATGVADMLGSEVRDAPVRALAKGLSSALAAFVKTGDPSGPLGTWPAYASRQRATMIADLEPHVKTDRLAERLDFWERHRDSSAPVLSNIFGTEFEQRKTGDAGA